MLNSNETNQDEFSTKKIRNDFVKKVYIILTIQLMIVLCFVLFFVFHKPTQKWVIDNIYMLYTAVGLSLVSILLLACFMNIRRRPPWNYIFLGIFTVTQGLMLGMLGSCYEPYPVLMAVSLTAIITLTLSVFALQTKWDLTLWNGLIICFSLPSVILGIVYVFVHNQILDYVYAAVTVALYSCYLVYDTQLMLIGKHSYSISPDDYVFAVLNLYVDIVFIYRIILGIFKTKTDEE